MGVRVQARGRSGDELALAGFVAWAERDPAAVALTIGGSAMPGGAEHQPVGAPTGTSPASLPAAVGIEGCVRAPGDHASLDRFVWAVDLER